jgi:DNA-binding transcriptional LysR family regulator
MELRQLRCFIAVAEELHFGHAAQRLHLAQPALSRQIQNFEHELGIQLLFRTRRRVELTAAGAIMLEQARSLLRHAEQAVRAARLAAQGRTGWLAVGFVGSATYDVLPASLKLFRQRSPGVEVTLSEMTTAEQVQALHEKRIHIGFLRPPVRAGGLVLETIIREPVMVALPRGHRLARRTSISLRALAGEEFILYPREPRPSWIDYVTGLCREAGFEPHIAQETMEIQTSLSLVAGGVGVTVVPGAVSKMPRRGVVCRRLSRPSPNTELLAAYRQDERSPVLRDFLNVARECGHSRTSS